MDDIQSELIRVEAELQEANSAMLARMPYEVSKRLPDGLSIADTAQWIEQHSSFIAPDMPDIRTIAESLNYLIAKDTV